MYLHIIDFIKNTSYRNEFFPTGTNFLKEGSKALPFIEIYELKDILLENIECLVTEGDFVNMLLEKYKLTKGYNIICDSIEFSDDLATSKSHIFRVFKSDANYKENQEYTISSSSLLALREVI